MWIQATFTASLVSSDKTKRSEESDVLYSRENNPWIGGSAEPQKQCSILSERFWARVFYRASEEAMWK